MISVRFSNAQFVCVVHDIVRRSVQSDEVVSCSVAEQGFGKAGVRASLSDPPGDSF